MKLVLSAIFLTLSMLNTSFAGPFVRPKPIVETPATAIPSPDPKKLDEAAAIVTALKHCLSMDGSLNKQPRLIDAFNHQPDLDNLPKDMSDEESEKTLLYTMGRPDIPDFGFLIADRWRVTPRNSRIKFNAAIALVLSKKLDFRNNAYAFDGNCKTDSPTIITTGKDGFEHAIVSMPLAFDTTETRLSYNLTRQPGYNWQINNLLINNKPLENYLQKGFIKSVFESGVDKTTNEICLHADYMDLKCAIKE